MNNSNMKQRPIVPAKRIVKDAASDGQGDGLMRYHTERDRAQALAIDASMERRRRSAFPDLCDGNYEVFEQ